MGNQFSKKEASKLKDKVKETVQDKDKRSVLVFGSLVAALVAASCFVIEFFSDEME